ncbi:MAG: 5-(carboxyamino)imidazole ribonucleotide mutase, partial [Pseudomonadota bacterium]
GLLAGQIVALNDADVADRLEAFRTEQTASVADSPSDP